MVADAFSEAVSDPSRTRPREQFGGRRCRLPTVYVQRHCLELIVKDLILACFYIAEQQDLAGENRCGALPPEREHKFGKLLAQLKRSLIEVGYGRPAQLSSLEALALRFTRLERGSRERFRYALPDPFKDGKAPRHSFEKPVEIPVHELQEALRQVHHDCVDIDNDESLLRQLYDESGALFEKAARLGRVGLRDMSGAGDSD